MVGRADVFDVPSLDGIRAASVMLVFAAHAGLSDRVPGGFGVTVFFFLSGYLITTLLRLEAERSGRISLSAFYLRRALRILPPMYVVLAAAVALSIAGVVATATSGTAIALQLLHLTNVYTIANGSADGLAPGTGVYWSLAVEEHFYLLFPLLYIGLRRFCPAARGQAFILLSITVAILIWRVVLVMALAAPADRTYIATDTRIDSILFGCVLGIFGNPALDPSRVGERWWKWLLVPTAVATLLITFLVRDPRFQETARYTLQGLALFPLFVVAIRYPGWGPFRLLTVRWIRFVGVLSYTLYLLHQVVLFAVQAHTTLHPVLQGTIALAVALSLSVVIHLLIERPCARLRRKLARVHRTSDALPFVVAAPATSRPVGSPAL